MPEKNMKRGWFRVSVPASIFFDVEANSEAEARETARTLADDWLDGLWKEPGAYERAGTPNLMVYADELEEATVEDGPEDEDPNPNEETNDGKA